MKAAKLLAIIFALICAFSAMLFVLSSKSKAPAAEETVEENAVFSLASSEYTRAVTAVGEGGKIYLPLGAEGYYYTADLKNNIGFYQLTSEGFVKVPGEVKTASVSLNASGQSIPVKVKYIDIGGSNYGVGVFTSDMSSSVKYYGYAFVKLVKMPEGYGKSYLLLADYTKEDFFRADKVYDDIFEYDMKASSVSLKLSQNTRLIDSNATYKQSWDNMTDEFIASIGKAKLFMSSRYYTEEEFGRRTDIMEYSSNYRPAIAAKDILGTWFVNDADGMHYLKKDNDGFVCITAVTKDGKKSEKKGASFSGDYFADYLRSGSTLFNKNTGEAVNLLTGDKVTFSGADFKGADIFSVSPDGKKAVIAFYGEENSNGAPVQKIIYACSDGTAETAVYSEPLLFSESSGFVWVDSSSVMSARAAEDSGENVGSVIYTFKSAQ